MKLLSYSAEYDADAVYALWLAALGEQWPIDGAVFHKLLTDWPLYVAGDHFVARKNDRIIGFVATRMDRGDPASGAIPALYVDPQFHRRGIGTALHEAALGHLREIGARTVQVGGGLFWPGVPDNLPAAKPFFQARGWNFAELCYDLSQPVGGYKSPEDLTGDILLELAAPDDAPALLEFERREFPNWLGAFRGVLDAGDFDDLLLARDRQTREIIGALILYSHRSHPSRVDGLWTSLLGDPLGEIGCVGVAEAAQGRGIGTAMVARASETLKQRGVAAIHIGWVYRVDFYGRLGYAKWRAFHMSWRDL